MRCGKCGREAASANEVRACYGGADQAHGVSDKFTDSGMHEVSGDGPFNPPSEKQVDYLLGLQESRVLPDGYKAVTRGEAFLMERPTVSSAIELLKHCQKGDSGNRQKSWDNIPEGRYALYKPGPDDTPGAYSYVDRQDLVPPSYGKWMFYQVDKPTEGRWKGYTFVKMLIGAPGSYRKESLKVGAAMKVLERINEDPKKAMLDYGLQSGVCGRCSSPLTDPDSLARGIGPKCAAKSGWF